MAPTPIDPVAAEERRVLALAEDYRERDDSDAPKDYIDGLFELAAVYRDHARSYDATRALRKAIRVIKESGAREAMLPEARLELVEIEVATGEPDVARKALAAAQRAIDRVADARERAALQKRAGELATTIEALPHAPPSQATRERWRHPRFGEAVLERRDDDVLHLRFADGTVRKLSAQYVTRIEG